MAEDWKTRTKLVQAGIRTLNAHQQKQAEQFKSALRAYLHHHMKRQIMGREVVVAVTNGKLDFGTWEQIFYAEFDGRRKKRVLVKVIGE